MTKGKTSRACLIGVDILINAFTMHSFFTTMLSKNDVTMLPSIGAFGVFNQKNHLIHLFIHQINSL